MRNRSFGSTSAVLATVTFAAIGVAYAPMAAGAAVEKPTSSRDVESVGEVPGGFGSWQQLLAEQERLVKAADRISSAARSERSGYAGIVVSAEKRELQLFYKGATPSALDSVLSDVRDDVRVSLHRAKHSESELTREARRLAAKAKTAGQISSIAPNADGSGLTVSVSGGSTTKARGVVADATVPVAFETAVSPSLASRWNDSPAWWGGAAWANATRGGGCSTGFAVWHAGRTKMLTAGHCANLWDRATDPTGELMGYVSEDNNPYDVQLIDARSAGRVFNNNPSLSEWSNSVIGTAGSYVGMWISTSGAYSGTRSGIQVKQTGVSLWVGYWIYNTVRAEKADFTNAIGKGDSGGAVQVVASDTTKVYAAGINSAIDTSTQVPCTGYVTGSRVCAWRMYYAPMSSASALFGTSIVTG